jgi:hypothetical protein
MVSLWHVRNLQKIRWESGFKSSFLKFFWHVWEVNKKSRHFQSLYFSFSQMVSSRSFLSSKSFSSSLSFNEELFKKIEMKNNICFNFVITTVKPLQFFNFDEIEEGVVNIVNFKVNVQNTLQTMQSTPTLLKVGITCGLHKHEQCNIYN